LLEKYRVPHLDLFIVKRKLSNWIPSYHKELELNDRNESLGAGQGLTRKEMLRLPRVKLLFEPKKLISELSNIFSPNNIYEANFEGQWIAYLFHLLKIPSSDILAKRIVAAPHVNISIPDSILPFIIRINKLVASDKARISLLAAIGLYYNFCHESLRNYLSIAISEGWKYLDLTIVKKLLNDMPPLQGVVYHDNFYYFCNKLIGP
jgi:hypothetical protein